MVVRWSDAEEVGHVTSGRVLIETAAGAARQVARQAPIAIDPAAPDRFEVDSPVDPRTLRAEIEGDVNATLLALSGVAALTSVLGIANAMTMGVVQRTSEFGLRRAIGARPRHLLAQVITESGVVGLLGGLLGLYLGMGGLIVVTIVNRWQPVLDLQLAPVALAIGTLVGMLGGTVAATRASRIQPIEALRH
ncbi:MAG TPA: ABC transporter permease [Acidimicrobiales bacterium]